jgi:hypothetical protein
MRDVARVMIEMRDREAEFGAQDRGGQLRDEFLGCVGSASEPALEVSPEPRGVSGRVRELVCEGCVVVVIAVEQRRLRQRDPIGDRFVIGFGSLVS